MGDKYKGKEIKCMCGWSKGNNWRLKENKEDKAVKEEGVEGKKMLTGMEKEEHVSLLSCRSFDLKNKLLELSIFPLKSTD